VTVEKVEVAFDVAGNPTSPFVTLNDPVKGILGSTQYVLGGSIYYDVTDKVKSISTSRGKSRQLDQYTAGNANVVFDNQDRTFDPLYSGSPYAGQIIPRRPVRITTNEEQVAQGQITNLATNPSFEGQSLVTTTNLITNPSLETNTTGWVASGGTVTRITTDSVFGVACGRHAATAVNNLAYIDTAVTPSQVYTFSLYLKGEVGKTFLINIEERTASAAVGGTASATITANGTWQRVSVTRTFGATGVIARTWVQNRFSGAHTILFDGAMFTVGTGTQTYFDGNTTDVNDTTFAWTGTTNNSSSTEQSNTVVSVRRNLAVNPNIELNTSTIGGTRMTLALETTTKYFGNQAVRATANSIAGIQYVDASIYTILPSLPYTASVYLFMPLTNSSDRSVRLEMHPYNGTSFGVRFDGNQSFTVPRGQWTRITATGTSPASAVGVLLRLVSTTTLALNDVMIVDGYLLEQSNTLGEYFDGNFGNSGDYDYRWAGVIGSSTSEQLVRQIVGSSVSTNSAAGMSRAWDATGLRSLLVAPNASNNDSHIRFSFAGLTNGATYTAMVKCRLSAPLTGTLNARSRQISAWNSTFTTNAGSDSAPNIAGTYDLRFTFTANDTTMIIALHNGASVNNGFVWFDNLLLVQGDYEELYFDGNTQPTDRYTTYSWTGTAENSTSVKAFSAYTRGVVFNGLINDWDLTYNVNGESIASISASDGMSLLSNQNLVETDVPQQYAGPRLNTILSNELVNWPQQERFLQNGTYPLQAQTIEDATNALSYIQKVAESDNGSFFIGKDGTATYLQGDAPDYSSAILFSDDGEGIPYSNLSIVYGSELLYNNFVLTRLGAETLNVSYPESIDEYGTYSLNKDGLLLQNASDMVDLALQLGAEYSQPEYRFESISIHLTKLSEYQQSQILQLELGSIVQVIFTPNNIGDPINQYAEVTGIDHMAVPLNHTVKLKLAAL
jgi:hypothetical protein